MTRLPLYAIAFLLSSASHLHLIWWSLCVRLPLAYEFHYRFLCRHLRDEELGEDKRRLLGSGRCGVSSVGVFNVAVARRWLSVPWTGMSRAIIALSLYDLSWSPRSNGDCTVPDDVVRRVSVPTAARHSSTIGRPSPCQVSSAPDTGWSIISPIILLLPRLSLGLLKARGRPFWLGVSVRGWLTKPCGASSPGCRSIRCRYSRPAVSRLTLNTLGRGQELVGKMIGTKSPWRG
ncbi:hypothetical protein B296_00004624 [Ensete ventricosum]|uniref:Uncharacterized protein n=1 Tax=Ensete ventricosum TaxID=4639 RepID=A0A427B9F3_ENSVE|nr:hypothetical protein B296_00004624 [Ensete ventricosum]